MASRDAGADSTLRLIRRFVAEAARTRQNLVVTLTPADARQVRFFCSTCGAVVCTGVLGVGMLTQRCPNIDCRRLYGAGEVTHFFMIAPAEDA